MWAKLALVAIKWAILLVLAILFAVLVAATGNETLLFVLLLVWIALARIATFVIDRYFGYLIKAGHVAVVARAVNEGRLVEREDMVEVAKEEVKSRFAASNVFFVIDNLVSGAVRQLQRGTNKIGDMLDRIPGVKMIMSIISMFIGIFLNYVDECCLGWIFLNKEQGAFKSAVDAVVLYFQNVKGMLKNSAKVVGIIVAYNVISWTLAIICLAAIPNQVAGIIVGALVLAIAGIIRGSFVDSYIMISVMVAYGEYAMQSTVQYDLYAKMCKLSSEFKKLFENAETEANGGTVVI